MYQTLDASDPTTLLDAKQVQTVTKQSQATLFRKTKAGTFPLPRYLGPRRVWYKSEIEEWMRANILDAPLTNNINPDTLIQKEA